MSDEIWTTGIVLSSAPAGDYDRRVVLLTRERGKITAFARGARRPSSKLLSSVTPFTFGQFGLYPGRSAFTLARSQITYYFADLKEDFDASLYGFYFLDLAAYYGRENLDAAGMLNLLYVTLRALEKKQVPFDLVRRVYEIRLMVENGEYPPDSAADAAWQQSTRYAVEYAMSAPLPRLYSFTVSREVQRELDRLQEKILSRILDRRPRSLDILESMTAAGRGKAAADIPAAEIPAADRGEAADIPGAGSGGR